MACSKAHRLAAIGLCSLQARTQRLCRAPLRHPFFACVSWMGAWYRTSSHCMSSLFSPYTLVSHYCCLSDIIYPFLMQWHKHLLQMKKKKLTVNRGHYNEASLSSLLSALKANKKPTWCTKVLTHLVYEYSWTPWLGFFRSVSRRLWKLGACGHLRMLAVQLWSPSRHNQC